MGMEGAPGQRQKEMVRVKCPACNGTGKQGTERCTRCSGTGQIVQS